MIFLWLKLMYDDLDDMFPERKKKREEERRRKEERIKREEEIRAKFEKERKERGIIGGYTIFEVVLFFIAVIGLFAILL